MSKIIFASLIAFFAITASAYAQSISDVASGFTGAEGSWSGQVIQLVGLLTVLSLAPGILIMVTSFTRYVIVFSLLRTALGLNQTPPNIVIISMALFMTFYVMSPTMDKAWNDGLKPLLDEQLEETVALERMIDPFKDFMNANVRESDLELFTRLGVEKGIVSQESVDSGEVGLRTLIPAFMISEIRRAFEIGFLLFLPFLVIDMVVASILMAMGMMMLPPIMISMPFKIIFFVLIDGWALLTSSLINSYNYGVVP